MSRVFLALGLVGLFDFSGFWELSSRWLRISVARAMMG